MAYSENLRQRVRQYVSNGGSKAQASRLFGVSRTAIYRWLNDKSPRKKPGCTKPDKLDDQALLEEVRRYPNKLLRERAEDFSMRINGIWAALKRLGIKKKAEICRTLSWEAYRLKVKQSGSDSLVYVDESGLTHESDRPHGWGAKGQRVDGDGSGKRFSPLLFSGTCTTALFNRWLEQKQFSPQHYLTI